MKKTTNFIKAFLFGALVVGFTACDKDDPTPPTPPTPTGPSMISGNITTNTTWTADKKYVLDGFVYVKDGVTLTIEPGTIIRGDKQKKGSLIVERGGKIMAVGTKEKPIVFTSNLPAGQRAAGDWGGVIIMGKAPQNKPGDPVIEGEGTAKYGGDQPNDNSGKLKYVRIEFAGVALATDNEINGLTMGGVGSGTEIDYVQVSYGGDDSFEWFGGTVNAKHLISYRGLDDDFDTDNGFSGNVQYGLIIRDPKVADQAGDSNAFESDNDGTGTTATPQTSAKFANITATIAPGTLDSKYRSALRLRRNTALSVYNSLFVAPYVKGLEVENPPTIENYKTGKLVVQGLVLQGAVTPLVGVDETIFNTAANKNKVYTNVADLMLDANFNSLTTRPVLLPKAGSPLLTGGVTLPAGFEPAPYIGAFKDTDWTAGWANFDPQNTDY
ncbi:T9SS C-terminal target domain-containing protein [Persicitalea sp.]|uniref:T9SS C-terminal target domain-containing protein n=1 Tax=Persicitalea sp. TaxID=3100273 RepID=UPI003594422E